MYMWTSYQGYSVGYKFSGKQENRSLLKYMYAFLNKLAVLRALPTESKQLHVAWRDVTRRQWRHGEPFPLTSITILKENFVYFQ